MTSPPVTERREKKVYKTKLEVSPFGRAKVDILIPFHGQYEKVVRLIEGILYAVRSNPYLITLIDDGSPNYKFVENLKGVPQINTVRLEQQVGFASALHAGYKATQQPWVMVMHSDCEIEDPMWMIHMGESMLKLKGQNVKLITAKTNNPGPDLDPRLKADTREMAVGDDVILDDGFVPLYCALVHRELFSHIGGFLKPYPYAWHEDEELGHRMRHYGYKQAICGNAWVKHDGGATIKALWEERPSAKEVMEKNFDLCLADIQALYKSGGGNKF